MLVIQNITYLLPNKDILFENLSLTVNSHEKTALIGNNGAGKSTLLKLIAGELKPASGQVVLDEKAYYVPQIFGQYNHLTVAEALGIDQKLSAFYEILAGNVTDETLSILNDDWLIEDRVRDALNQWGLNEFGFETKLENLSGGQKTKVFLAGISIHQPKLVLLDEPSNHLDSDGRALLYRLIEKTDCSMIVVSHDRTLLQKIDSVQELSRKGITAYGGNYDFYLTQKQIEKEALAQDIQSKEKALRKAKEKERESAERQQKLDARGKGKQEKAGVSRIMMNTLRNQAEKSTSKLKNIHAEKIGGISSDLQELRSAVPDRDKMKFGLGTSELHSGKILFEAVNMNFGYEQRKLWEKPLNIQIRSGERVAIYGTNGSGKSTLIRLLLGEITAASGTLFRADAKVVVIDQDYSLIDPSLKVIEQAQRFNTDSLPEHEVNIRLNRFLFPKESWDKPCAALSGGERMRLLLCCLTLGQTAPDVIILDEPTNNLDIQNVEILTAAANEYRGTLLVVSHDAYFRDQIGLEKSINL